MPLRSPTIRPDRLPVDDSNTACCLSTLDRKKWPLISGSLCASARTVVGPPCKCLSLPPAPSRYVNGKVPLVGLSQSTNMVPSTAPVLLPGSCRGLPGAITPRSACVGQYRHLWPCRMADVERSVKVNGPTPHWCETPPLEDDRHLIWINLQVPAILSSKCLFFCCRHRPDTLMSRLGKKCLVTGCGYRLIGGVASVITVPINVRTCLYIPAIRYAK